ncbi:MAG: S1-like domain-containing RNA-binding protein [Pelovirga sp.]
MLLPGYYYQLTINRIDSSGVWLDGAGEEILLPHRESPTESQTGDMVTVFLYLDRSHTMRATTRKAAAQVGEYAFLQVKDKGPQGAFLDWGIAKDLLAPVKEQSEPMQIDRRYLVRVCHDQQHRPMASARLEKYLFEENRDLRQGDQVELIVWMFTDLGTKVIVNHLYSGLVYSDDLIPGLKCGDKLTGYIAKIRPDGKLDISLQPAGIAGIDSACELLLARLKQQELIELTDQSPPEAIRSQLGISKKLFKKAVGHLYKEGRITLTPAGIRLIR